MQARGAPIRIGILYDFPLAGGDFEAAVRLGIEEVAAGGRLDRPVELVARRADGLPTGTEHALRAAFRDLDETGALMILGPAISDNGLVVRELADAAGIACINYTGGELTRSEFMFQYQVGSLEEEPGILAARLAHRGLRSAAVLHDHSPVGLRFAEFFQAARAGLGIEVTGSATVSPLAEDVRGAAARLREGRPEALVYLGLGFSSRALALALRELDWELPVLANSALMFGYQRPEWREGWRGWEYVDGVAEDNRRRRALRERSPAAAATPVGCAAVDMGRLVAEAAARAHNLTRAGIKDGLERVKWLPATCGVEGTLMGFGRYDRAALKGHYLVLREWRDGASVQVADSPAT